MKKLTFLTASAALMFAACSEPLEEAAEINNGNAPEKIENTISHWGNKIEDPYTVDNMRRAYDELTKDGTNSLAKKGLLKEQITPTHLHLKFIPKTNEELEVLKKDSILDVVPIPYDYDLEGFNGIYRDPECPEGQPTYQYSVVRIEHQLPNIEYIILDSLYLPFDDENEQQSLSKKASFRTLWEQLELTSLKLTGNFSEEDYIPKTLDKKYHPKGKVEYQDDTRGKLPVPNARIHVNFSTHKHNCYTNADGTFYFSNSFSSKVHFHVYFENSDYQVCYASVDDVIGSYGGRGKSCYDFNIDKPAEKAAAVIHLAGYNFFNETHNGLNTSHNIKNGTHFINDSRFGSNLIVFVNNEKCVQFVNYDLTPHSSIYGSAINGFTGLVLENQIRAHIFDYEEVLQRAWRTGVEWYLTKDIYPNAYNNKQCLIKDLMDYDNSTNDNVGGFTIEDINNCVLRTRTWNDFKNELKRITSSTTNKNNLDKLFDYWENR